MKQLFTHEQRQPVLDDAKQLISAGSALNLLSALDTIYEASGTEKRAIVSNIKAAGERYLRYAYPWGFPATSS